MLKKFSAAVAILSVLPFASQAQKWGHDWNSVSLYDASTSVLIHRFPLEGAVQSASRDLCPPGLALAATGEAYATSNATPVVWRVDPVTGRVERFDLEVDVDQSKDFGFSRLAWSADGRTLYAASSTDGAMWRLDLAAAKAFKVGAAGTRAKNCR
jgi:hypothetical protein